MEPSTSYKNNNRTLAKLAILIAIVIIAIGVKAFVTKKPSNDTTSAFASTAKSSQPTSSSSTGSSNPAGTDNSATTDTPNNTSTYKDGTYSATGQYESPGGTESITISLTLKNDTISSTSAQSGANDRDAAQFQSDFIAGYKSLVVGKSIDSVSLSRVSGSSLTSQGFNEAIDKIKSQAKV